MSIKRRIAQFQTTRSRRQVTKENTEIKRLTMQRDKAVAAAGRAAQRASLQAEIAIANQKKLTARGKTGGSGAMKFLGQQLKNAGKQLVGDLRVAARNISYEQNKQLDRELGSNRRSAGSRTTTRGRR